jgi:hypothetical protein
MIIIAIDHIRLKIKLNIPVIIIIFIIYMTFMNK